MEVIAVVDYGGSNLYSVSRALRKVAKPHQSIVIAQDAETLKKADRIVFPGQGAIHSCMAGLRQFGLLETLKEMIANRPYLGLCLGLQLLLEEGEEGGGVAGFGLLPGTVVRFSLKEAAATEDKKNLKIPHMGWNRVWQNKPHCLWQGIDDGSFFYFVHSYYAIPKEKDDRAAHTDHIVRFASALARDNLFSVQFHPEKSQDNGLGLLSNFLSWKI